MKAVQFNFTLPRYALGLALGRFIPSLLLSGLSTTSLKDVTPPELPGPDWLRIKTHLGGICGTDLGAIYLHTSPYYTPFGSYPFTFGQENVSNSWETIKVFLRVHS